jgi:hemoglobin
MFSLSDHDFPVFPIHERGPVDKMMDKQPTLFERVGGDQTIAELIEQFYDRVVADPELKSFFRNVSMVKIHRMQREFFSAALDGPSNYTGRPLGHVHHGMGITKHHFSLYVGHLIDALQNFSLKEQDVQDIISRISTYANEITGDTASGG